MKNFHTIIIGAGPGGLTCATLLAKQGHNVLVLEKNQRIGPKICGGGVTWSGLTQHLPESLLEKSFHEQFIFSGWQQVKISSPQPIISTVSREKLGQCMLKQAIAAGTQIKTGTLVRKITSHKIITANGEEFGYDFLVGADGSSSLVRRFLKIGTRRSGTGINLEVKGDFDRMEWHLNTELLGSGYAWIFPHKDHASIGAYAYSQAIKPATLLKNFNQWAQKRGINLDKLRPKAALINFDYRGWRFNNIFLVGDAAGLASGYTGEGIFPAIISGETVARCIMDPEYDITKLKRLIRRHQAHSLFVRLTSSNRLLCKIVTETLIAALKTKIIHFSALEMGAKE
ncbi:MAG: NAD(P)/FAD-dependent oxidoreductase [Proteobacteria bacterium]|nr:NAD(P)/FAD-dependent oxidoreductase [Pseudomonadota bacterium]MBU1716093.1 NAD(P)/FAD-dependent oxidoreductase [Pseudomonadota bacterium]